MNSESEHVIAIVCNVCGNSLEHYTDDGKKVTFTGVKVSLTGLPEQVIAPYGNGTYRICYPCWLKSLGIKAG